MSDQLVSVWLIRFHADAAANSADALTATFGIDRQAAQALIDRLPAVVKQRATPEQATHYREALRAIGGEVAVRPLAPESRTGPLTDNPPTSAPPPAEHQAQAIPIEEPGPSPVRAGQVCINHPVCNADYYCGDCGLSLCGDCVEAKGAIVHCRRCQRTAQRYVERHIVRSINDYLAELPASLLFFARRDVFLLLIATTLLVWPISAMASMPANIYGFIGATIQAAIEAALFLHLIRQVAFDVSEVNAPDFTNLFDDLLIPLWKYLFACLPMIVAILWTASIVHGGLLDFFDVKQSDPLGLSGPRWLFLGGFLLWPVTTLIAAMSASILSVMNPVEWGRSIRSIGSPLAVGAPLFYAFVIFEAFVVLAVADELLEIAIVGRPLALLLSYLALAVRARLLGSLVIGRL